MSSEAVTGLDKEALSWELAGEVRALQSAVEAVDAAAAARLGINQTDLRCLDVLLQRESAAPGELGAALGLTTGSVTAMLDRLDKLGYLTREPDPGDRRRSVVRASERTRKAAEEIYRPLAEEAHAGLQRYSAEELGLLLDFVRGSREVQEKHVSRIRG
ncbi:MarR family transcriptional regulator [Streptomyces niveiscabiei]|uniref:MarR family transcriptional regulator n=1 Tax=Streptomyces niveiscabiei TaxID=164115 RepID=A0ABW9HPM3_9ACTN|nr:MULTISPECIES: MarR family transcriptional regulator [Streptomyces]MDX3380109.1 MarR family transcriptional regulator [Streptomyces niveiscabiei]QZZ30739.1 MarR family transcriptional regulator [Streptomyces sp. ST1015]